MTGLQGHSLTIDLAWGSGIRHSTWLLSRWLMVGGLEDRFVSGSGKIRSAWIGVDPVPDSRSVCSLEMMNRK